MGSVVISSKRARAEAVQANRNARESHYARINWHAHVVPIVETCFARFCSVLEKAEQDPPYLSRLSDAAQESFLRSVTEEVWGDSITISFGARPIPIRPTLAVKGRQRVLSEKQASLVISQMATTGSVIVAFYPPHSEISRPEKPYYVARLFADPRDLRPSIVMSLLRELYVLDLRCAAVVSPSKRCAKVMARLKAREDAFNGRPSSLWGLVRYGYYLAKGLFALWRNAHALP
jgi:hypothetical protein